MAAIEPGPNAIDAERTWFAGPRTPTSITEHGLYTPRGLGGRLENDAILVPLRGEPLGGQLEPVIAGAVGGGPR